MSLVRRKLNVLLLAFGLGAVAAPAQQVHVMMSGAFTAAYQELLPGFEKQTHLNVATAYGPSMGGAPDSIPMRLERREPADVVILARTALDDLVKQGTVAAATCVDLVESSIGAAVRSGAPKPDIGTLDAFKRALLNAKSIAISDSASGVYFTTELFPRLGIADQVMPKCKRVTGQVGLVVARGEAEIGFQQISELRPVQGIDVVGALPQGAQRITIFSAGITVDSKNPEGARKLIEFLSSSASRSAIIRSGLEPVH
jgi:molybdate transport system substrate-binding protein